MFYSFLYGKVLDCTFIVFYCVPWCIHLELLQCDTLFQSMFSGLWLTRVHILYRSFPFTYLWFWSNYQRFLTYFLQHPSMTTTYVPKKTPNYFIRDLDLSPLPTCCTTWFLSLFDFRFIPQTTVKILTLISLSKVFVDCNTALADKTLCQKFPLFSFNHE